MKMKYSKVEQRTTTRTITENLFKFGMYYVRRGLYCIFLTIVFYSTTDFLKSGVWEIFTFT